MKLEYSDNKLIIPEHDCTCNHHIMPDTNIYIGEGILERAPEYISSHIKGKNCVLVTDENLYALFGKQITNILSPHYNMHICIPPTKGKLKPDAHALGYILLETNLNTDFFIAFGSGTVNDLVRYAAANMGKPFASIGTAPSMDGYLSVVSPLLKGNLKINKPADYPVVGIYDLDIMKTAPFDMIFAGFGDVIGKYIAKADWLLSSFVTGEKVCPYCLNLVDSAIALCENNIYEIQQQTSVGIKLLLEALLLTGLAMLVNTNSRPAASNEHNMAHYWEMMKLRDDKPSPSHGEAVGIATLYCLDFYEKFLSVDNFETDVSKLPSDAFSPEIREKLILEKYGKIVGRSIIDDNPNEPISTIERQRRIFSFFSNLTEIKKILGFLPSRKKIESYYRILNGPLKAEEIGIEYDLLKDALIFAKDYRDRYNVFKTAEELGLLRKTIDSILS